MKALHLVGGEKGGVGKSFTARLLSQYFIDNQTPFFGFDTDGSHNTFSRFYGEYIQQVSVNEFSELDLIIDTIENEGEANIVVDLAAQTRNGLQKWMEESDLEGILEELQCQLYMWHVMDDGADAMFLLKSLLEKYEHSNIQLIVVQNYGRGKSFQEFERSPIHALARLHNAKFFLLPRLQEELAKKIDFSSSSFWAASNNRELMKTVERHRVKAWLKFCYQQMSKILEQPDNFHETALAQEAFSNP